MKGARSPFVPERVAAVRTAALSFGVKPRSRRMAAPTKSGHKSKRGKAAKKSVRQKPPAAAVPAAPGSTPAPGGSLAARVQRVVERELNAVERILDNLGPTEAGEAERAARTLASLARTLREVALSNDGQGAPQADEPDDDPIPRDIDEFRRELACRIDAFIASQADSAVPDDAEDALERPPGARLA